MNIILEEYSPFAIVHSLVPARKNDVSEILLANLDKIWPLFPENFKNKTEETEKL